MYTWLFYEIKEALEFIFSTDVSVFHLLGDDSRAKGLVVECMPAT
jgi:hypothetical protein